MHTDPLTGARKSLLQKSESQATFAKDSACDRQMFAYRLPASRTAHLCSRENRVVSAVRGQGSPFSAVRLVEQESRNMAVFRIFLGKSGREFSAVQTVWRRGRDSNLRYSFEALSLEVSVSYRLQTLGGEFSLQPRPHDLAPVRFGFAIH